MSENAVASQAPCVVDAAAALTQLVKLHGVMASRLCCTLADTSALSCVPPVARSRSLVIWKHGRLFSNSAGPLYP